jgi:hypothetical protein
MAAAFAVALVMVIIIRLVEGPGERIGMGLRATGRWSFAWFWLASTGGALATLFGSRFVALAERCRDFGLAFASAHLVHLALVAMIYFGPGDPPSQSTLVFFSIAAFLTYLLAAFSVKSVSAKLNPRVLHTVRIVAVEYISLVFIADFDKNLLQGGTVNFLIYFAFLALAVAGPLLRIAAAVKRHSRVRALAAQSHPR